MNGPFCTVSRLCATARPWLPVAILGFLVVLVSPANAAVVAYTDYSAFQNDSLGIETVVDFDSLGGGASIATVDGVGFSSDGGNLVVYSGSTPSPSNYIGNGNFAFRELSSEFITITLPEASNAVGIFVVHEDFRTDSISGDILSNENIGIVSAGVEASSLNAVAFDDYNDGTAAFFVGLRDDTGANSINSFVLRDPDGSGEYFFDSQTRFTVTAVPEPGSLLLAGIGLGGLVWRRRRTRPAAPTARCRVKD